MPTKKMVPLRRSDCALLASIEPLTGKRLAQVHGQRTKKEYTIL